MLGYAVQRQRCDKRIHLPSQFIVAFLYHKRYIKALVAAERLTHTQTLLIGGGEHYLVAHIHIRQTLTDSLHSIALRVGKEHLYIASLFELGLVIRTGCGGQCQSG